MLSAADLEALRKRVERLLSITQRYADDKATGSELLTAASIAQADLVTLLNEYVDLRIECERLIDAAKGDGLIE